MNLLTAIAIGYVAFGSAYLYLQVRSEAWPPPGIEPPDLLVPAIFVGVLAATCVPAWFAVRRLGSVTGVTVGLLAAIVFGAVFLGWQIAEVVAAPFGHSEHVYGSLFYVISIFHLLNVFVAAMTSAIAILWTGRARDPRRAGLAVRVSALWWSFVAWMWVGTFAVLYLAPYVTPELLP
jgi:heme/copper-type cytochrome/quinol oxidase subunit 3